MDVELGLDTESDSAPMAISSPEVRPEAQLPCPVSSGFRFGPPANRPSTSSYEGKQREGTHASFASNITYATRNPYQLTTPAFSASRTPCLALDAHPELRRFLASLRVSQEHLAPIFIKYGFVTDDALDFLCEIPVMDWADMKDEIVMHGLLVGWLAVEKGLQERMHALHSKGA